MHQVSRPSAPLGDLGPGIEVHLVEHDRRRDAVGFRQHQESVDELWDGIGRAGRDDDEDLIDIGGDGTDAAAFRHPALQHRPAGLDADDRMQRAAGLGLEPHHIAHHHLRGVELRLAPEDGSHLDVVHADPIRRSVPLQDRAQERRHHAPGARPIASSSAAFTS